VPRIPRSQLPSPAYYHVVCRGVEQRKIFLDDIDRRAWRELFAQVIRRYRWRVWVWTLLDNHFHLLVEGPRPELSKGMQRLNGLYAMRFNRRYDRVGHLFQGRFHARVVEGDDDLEAVLEYIYENATRVGLAAWIWRGLRRRGPRADPPRSDYASARTGDERRDETQRAPHRRDRAAGRRSRGPPRRRARPLQRS
jgi:REP element-mobilizing transposase RayT